VFINMAYAYERLNQLEKSRLSYEQVVARAPKPEPRAYLGLAAIALQKGDIESGAKALESARVAYGQSAPSAAWYHYSGIEAMMGGDPERAVHVLAEGVARYPVSAVLLGNLSAAHEACGNFDEAREAHDRSAASASASGS
jgi:tetratricopeptide (TPR) repeat protein